MTKPTDLRTLPNGQVLSDYRIEGTLGQGGFGITYLATDTNLGRKVAIKEYFPREYATRDGTLTIRAAGNDEDRETFKWGLTRFLEEARILARFEHPNIVAVRRFFEANGTAYLVMDYCDGEPLDEIIKRDGPLSKERLDRILLPLLNGLEEIHSTNFLHRDIKPANIYIRRDGSPVLLDFGAARQETGNHSRSVTSLATAGYAAVEQYSTRGKQGPWTDIYGLGATLYRAVTGEKPQESTDRMLEDTLEPAADKGRGRYPVSLLAAIDAAMSVRPEQRPQSVAQWRQMISLESPPLQPKPAPKPGPRPLANLPPESRNRFSMQFYCAIFAFAGMVVIFGASYLDKSPGPAAPTPPVPTPITSSQPSDAALGKSRDCDFCPLMVVIPAGSFTMGSPNSEAGRDSDEGPLRQVDIVRSFSLGKFEITFGEFKQFVQSTGYSMTGGCFFYNGKEFVKDAGKSWNNPGFYQTNNDPVTCVSWDDATAYAKWLSKVAQKPYRLPSEAEWEYAARAQSKTAYSFGNSPSELSGYAWFSSNSEGKTHAVGSKQANKFGLYDMHGNVWEWTQDCWNGNYTAAPTDGSAWTEGTCSLRVARGGSWFYLPQFLRSAYRSGGTAALRIGNDGFRVARTD